MKKDNNSNKSHRNSCPEVFCEKGVLRNFAKFKGKHMCLSLFLIKLQVLCLQHFLKKGAWHMCFLVNFAKFLRTPLLTEQLRGLLLIICVKEHCVKSARIWSYTGLYFPSFGLNISPYSVRMRGNTDQNNSEYGHFLRSEKKKKKAAYALTTDWVYITN